MKHWSNTRRLSFAVHTAFVAIPFAAASVSALFFWHDLFQSWYFAVPMVTVIDLLALTGLILFIVRIPSPFVPLRHALPFVSIVPLARELYMLLSGNGNLIAIPVTALIIGIFTWIAWQCFREIEQLFVSPTVAARERERERLSQLTVELAQLAEHDSILHEFVSVLTAPRTITPALDDSQNDSTALVIEPSKSDKVKALAVEKGVSDSTAWRNVRKGKWSV